MKITGHNASILLKKQMRTKSSVFAYYTLKTNANENDIKIALCNRYNHLVIRIKKHKNYFMVVTSTQVMG